MKTLETLRKHDADASGKATSAQLRNTGCEVMDTHMKVLAAGIMDRTSKIAGASSVGALGESGAPIEPPSFLMSSMTSPAASPSSAASPAGEKKLEETRPSSASAILKPASAQTLERFDSTYMRKRMQHQTDRTLKRLFIDMELTRTHQQKQHAHRTRCDHLDKVYDWYLVHKNKDEDKKEARKPPPYIVYSKDNPVSPGSMRVQTYPRKSPLLSQSASAPSL